MQFNGKTVGDIVRDLCGEFRDRALSKPRGVQGTGPNVEVGIENTAYSSYADLEEEEDMI